MFVGSVPKELLAQVLDAVPFESWGAVHVCCSGSFRLESALRARFPTLRIVGNDVSLLSVALGRLAVGEPIDFRFRERLAPIEDTLADVDPVTRAAALLVAQEMATYRGKSRHAQAMFAHYLDAFPGFLAQAVGRVSELCSTMALAGFFAGDFRAHAARAVREGAGIVAFPPTYKAGYERLYKFLDDNVDWTAPDFATWDPADMPEWLRLLDQEGARYCVMTDRLLAGFEPAIRYDGSSRKTIFGYTSDGASSLRGKTMRSIPFVYRPVDPAALTKKSAVQIVSAEAGHLTFLKDKYLSRGIRHVAGQFNFLVLVDGALVGGFIYTRSRMAPDRELYLLSDFSISRESRLSKLVAVMATCRLPVDIARKRMMAPIERIETTAFTDHPVSMKYRGIFELKSRKPGQLQYRSAIRDASPDELYRDWFRKQA